MGVKGLMNMIKKHAPNAITNKSYKDFEAWKVALDMSLFIYKFVIAIRGKGYDLKRKDGRITSHIYGCFSKYINMIKHGIFPVPVFDGKPPWIKKETLKKRKEVKVKAQDALDNLVDDDISDIDKIKLYKRTFTMNDEHVKDIKTLTTLMGFKFIQAPGEADSQCAALNITKVVDGIATEDMDVLAFGAKTMLRKFSSKSNVVEINYSNVLKKLELTDSQFIDICIILGSDYCHPIKGISALTVYKKYKQFGSMDKFINHLNKENERLKKLGKKEKYEIPKSFIERWEEAKEYYLTAEIVNPLQFKFEWSEPNIQGLHKFLCKEHQLNSERVKNMIKYLQDRYQYYCKHKTLCIDLKKKEKSEIKEKSKGNKKPKADKKDTYKKLGTAKIKQTPKPKSKLKSKTKTKTKTKPKKVKPKTGTKKYNIIRKKHPSRNLQNHDVYINKNYAYCDKLRKYGCNNYSNNINTNTTSNANTVIIH